MTVSRNTPFQLVHVGKCGGSSVAIELQRNGFDFEHVHVRRPVFGPDVRYVILVRDPVERFVSAFNWRYHLLGQKQSSSEFHEDPIVRLKQQAEWLFLSHFQDVNDFAERLVPRIASDVSAMTTMMGLIGHAREGFSWYLDDLLGLLSPSQLLGVIAMERFPDDFETVFGFRPEAEQNRHYPSRRKDLSPLGRANLLRELKPDYRTLDRLAALASRAGVPMSVVYEPA